MRLLFRAVAVLAIYVGLLTLGICALKNGAVDIFTLRVNRFANIGKQTQDLDNTRGSFRANLLEHLYFRTRNTTHKNIFIIGSSFARFMPYAQFRYNGQTYDVYSFGFGGNSIVGPMKLMALMSEFKPDLVVFGLTALFIVEPFALPGAPFFDVGCNGPLKDFSILKDRFSNEPPCLFRNPSAAQGLTNGFWQTLLSLTRYVLEIPQSKEDVADIESFREMLGMAKIDFERTLRVLLRGAPSTGTPIQLGEFSESRAREGLAELRARIDSAGDKSLGAPKSRNGNDAEFRWEANYSPDTLNPNRSMDEAIRSIKEFGDKKGFRIVFYNTPTAYAERWVYPNDYYERYEKNLAALMERHKYRYLDAGRIFPYTTEWWSDFIHLREDRRDAIEYYILCNLVLNGDLP